MRQAQILNKDTCSQETVIGAISVKPIKQMKQYAISLGATGVSLQALQALDTAQDYLSALS